MLYKQIIFANIFHVYNISYVQHAYWILNLRLVGDL